MSTNAEETINADNLLPNAKEWLIAAAKSDYQLLAKLSTEQPNLVKLQVYTNQFQLPITCDIKERREHGLVWVKQQKSLVFVIRDTHDSMRWIRDCVKSVVP
uniref:Uncharacterized protein n=1 Tax=Anopheles maculatus TaxID=74869 RepID=A0A182T4J6_9DIPT